MMVKIIMSIQKKKFTYKPLMNPLKILSRRWRRQLKMGKDAGYKFYCYCIMNHLFGIFFPPWKNLTFFFLLQVYGVLDVQRVAGNFHVSVHGLNIYVAQMVGYFSFFINLTLLFQKMLIVILWKKIDKAYRLRYL